MGYTCITEDCFNPVENQDLGLCASCNSDRRKAEKSERKATQKRSQLINNQHLKSSQPRPIVKKVSDKRKELNKEYAKLSEQFKRDNPSCLARVNEYCSGKSESIHHKRGRGRYLLDVSTFLPCCLSCHVYIEAHPKEAIQKGWSLSRLQKETEPI